MMRYQRVNPDYDPLSNGSKLSFRCKEDGENGSKVILNNGGGFRFRSPSKPPPSQENNNHYCSNNNHNSINNINNNNNTTTSASSPFSNDKNSNSGRGGGYVLLQWGHKKRARVSRTETRLFTDDSSSSSSIHRRGGSPFIDKPKYSPPPPPSPLLMPLPLPHSHFKPPKATSASVRASNLRTKDSSGFINRNIEDRPGGANGLPSRNAGGGHSRIVSRSTAGKGSPHSSEKRMRKEEKTTNGSLVTTPDVQSEAEAGAAITTAANTVVVSMGEKVNVKVIEWPKIYVSLSRKEKEDDFLAIKGTKLPQRPKKRAKNIDRTLQYCFPGMWLSDLTKSRYEVREKKSVKKQKRRGLKGMESDSE